MKNKLQRIFLNLAAAMLIFSISGCADSGRNPAIEHLLTVWSDYLLVQENIYTSELWALEYTEKYLNTGDWNDLIKARAACIASARYLSELSMSEEDLSDEEYAVLSKAGIDISFQSMEFDSISEKINDAHMFVRDQVLEMLEGGVFLSGDIELMQERISLQKEYIAHMCQSEGLTTNHLLLELEDEKKASELWEALPEKYPTLCAEHQDWNDNDDALERNMEQCLKSMEDNEVKHAELLSAVDADYYNMKQIVENNDIDKLTESAFVMKNTPEFLPMPDWYDPETAKYLSFIEEEDGNLTYPESGDQLEDASYGVYLEIEGISAGDIDIYAEVIQDLVQDVWKDEDSDTWDIIMPDYNVRISLEEGTATLLFDGQDVTFAPEWYFLI